MRNRLMTMTAALVLASGGLASAQQKPAEPPATTPTQGWIEIGGRFTSMSGDAARFERYRDMRDGANVNFSYAKEGEDYLFSGKAQNIGYRDGRYGVDFANKKLKVSFMFDSTPLNYGYNTLTPWVTANQGSQAILTLDTAARTAVQNKQAGVVGIPSTAAQLLTPSIFRGLARQTDLQQRRDTLSFGLSYAATRDLTAIVSVNSYKRNGTQPWGASFAFNNGNEVPLPVDNRSTDVSAGLEWANQKGMFRVGWDGSWFDNTFETLVWDNPIRATDYNSAPGTGYDASGYSNGNGPARGRMALAPNSTMNVVSAIGMVKMPSHSTLNAQLAFTNMKQNGTLIPWTINPVIANATVYATFPALATLERATAEAEVKGINAQFNFNTRPNKFVSLQARYRYNDHQNHTPVFDAVEYVRFDAVPEETGGETEELNIKRNTFDVTATLNLMAYTALRVGYSRDSWDRTGRAFSNMADNIYRVSLDTVGNQYVMVRALFEHTRREGSGFSEASIEEGGAQPDLRFYDEANRRRNRGTLLFQINPTQTVDLNVSVATGKDVYDGPGHQFGLLDNKNTLYTFGVNINPRPEVAFGFNAGREKFNSFQKSRNSNPPPDPQWTDPNRDWTLDNDETVNNFDVYFDLLKALPKTDIRFAYDFSESDQAFVHGGPRVDPAIAGSLAAVGQFIPLANVTNKWHRATLDLRYQLTPKVGLGVGYWYEKFQVTDFATIDLLEAAGSPRIDNLGGLTTGYGNRPYTGSTGFVRLFYVF